MEIDWKNLSKSQGVHSLALWDSCETYLRILVSGFVRIFTDNIMWFLTDIDVSILYDFVCVSLNLIVVDLELQVRFGVYESVYERLFKSQ